METAPVIELGRAFIELVSGELPERPAGKIWIYGEKLVVKSILRTSGSWTFPIGRRVST